MIKKKNDLKTTIVKNLRDGIGKISITEILSTKEMKNKGKLFSRLSLEKGSSIGLHEHINDFEVYYILSGTGLVQEKDSKHLVSQGDVVYTTHKEQHSLFNTGEDNLEIIAVVINDE